MASKGMQLVGYVLALFGWLAVIIACALPMWRVTAFVGTNIVTSQLIWEGIWMSCVVESTGQMQCSVYEYLMNLSVDLQGARALVVLSIVTGVFGLIIAFFSAKCTKFIVDERTKAKTSLAAGVILIISGLFCIIPVSWTAFILISNFYNTTLVNAQKRELGASLYIGWAAGAMLILGGALLCIGCRSKEQETPPVKYLLNKSGGSSKLGSAPSFTESKTYI